MDQNAYFEKGLAIVRRLNECTYEAYLVGGIVRDHLMHMPLLISILPQMQLGTNLRSFPRCFNRIYDHGNHVGSLGWL